MPIQSPLKKAKQFGQIIKESVCVCVCPFHLHEKKKGSYILTKKKLNDKLHTYISVKRSEKESYTTLKGYFLKGPNPPTVAHEPKTTGLITSSQMNIVTLVFGDLRQINRYLLFSNVYSPWGQWREVMGVYILWFAALGNGRIRRCALYRPCPSGDGWQGTCTSYDPHLVGI